MKVRRKKKKVDATGGLAAQLDAATTLRFGGEEQALREEMNSVKAHRVTIGRAFDTYNRRLSEIDAAQKQGFQAAIAQQAALGQQLKSTIAPSAGGDATLGQAVQAQGQLQANLGLAESSDFGRRAASSDIARQQRLEEADSHLRQVGHRRQDLKAQEGAFAVDLLRQMQAEAAKNQIAAQGLGVELSKAQMDHDEFLQRLDLDKLVARMKGRDIKADNQLAADALDFKKSDAGTKNAIAQQNANANTRRALSGGGGAGGASGTGGMTKSQRREVFGDVRTLKALGKEFGELLKANNGNSGRATDAMKKRHRGKLAEGDINVARDLAVLGKVSPANQTYLMTKYDGYLPADFRGKPKKKAKKKGK